MTAKLDDLLAQVLRLPAEDRQRLRELLEKAAIAEANAVREAAATYQSNPMRFVTLTLPDDLAERAQDAGLLSGKEIEQLLRRALAAPNANENASSPQERRLVEKHGYLVAEALPGERRITTAEVRDILDDMEG